MTTEEELMKELNGQEGATIKTLDAAPQEKTPDPLEAPVLAAPTAVKKLDAAHSTAAGGRGYRILVRGEYFAHAKDGRGKVRKNYEIPFNLPSLESALGIIVGRLLTPALQRQDPDFHAYRTHEIVDVAPLSPDTPKSRNLQYMDRGQLEQYIVDSLVPLDPKDYPDVTHLRESVIDFTLNPKDFKIREEKRQALRRENADLAAMNPGLQIQAPV